MLDAVDFPAAISAMHLLLLLCAGVLLFAVASFLTVLSYGHFARHARGELGFALATQDGFSALDRDIAPRVEAAEGASGLALVSDNLDAFAVRALTARAAGRSLDLMYYYWKDDLTGMLLAREIVHAADRGVSVRLLLDDINTVGRDDLYLTLDRHPNISVRLFNPSRARHRGLRRGVEMVLRAFSVTRRMHNKAWIADGRIAVVGGRNIGDEYFDAAETSNFRDSDLILMGPLVEETEAVFDSYWNSEVVMPIPALVVRRRKRLDRLRRQLESEPRHESARPYLDRVRERISALSMLDENFPIHWTRETRIVSDPPEKALARGSENWIMATLMPVIAGADRSVEITSPYFVPGTDGTSRLAGMAKAGIDITVLTNSLAATDVVAVHGGYAPYRQALLAGGVKLFELQPYLRKSDTSLFGSRGASLHTKAFTVDGDAGFVGSFNFDPRSVSLNTEMGVLFVQPELVGRMREHFRQESSPHMSYRVFLAEDGSLRWQGEADGVLRIWDHEPEAGLTRRLVAKAVSWLPIESQL